MKEKGFTLIELLAVIVILSVITLITVPMITNVIEESKKTALASSIQGLVESANLYAIENDGVYEFLFDKEHQGSTIKGEKLEYKGNIDGEGKLYLDKEGNVSVCISNDTYYAYKNYNSGIIVGNKKTGNCIIGFDALTNKYVAMLDNGTGNVSNIYSKDEVNNLVDAKATELDTKIASNTTEITSIKSNIEELQNNLNKYALQSELEQTNNSLNNLSSLVNSNQKNIDLLNNNLKVSNYVISPSSPYYYSGAYISFTKIGKIVMVTVGDIQNLGPNKETTIVPAGFIQEEYRPCKDVSFSTLNTNGGLSRLIYGFYTDGSIKVYNYSSYTAAMNVRDTFMYITN